jgi:hypothetical protein
MFQNKSKYNSNILDYTWFSALLFVDLNYILILLFAWIWGTPKLPSHESQSFFVKAVVFKPWVATQVWFVYTFRESGWMISNKKMKNPQNFRANKYKCKQIMATKRKSMEGLG